MPPRSTDDPTLIRLERYLDAAPRAGAAAEDIGPFTLFISTGMWPYYARPRSGLDRAVTADDILAVRERQRSLGVPEAFEWVVEVTPSLSAAARETGLVVEELPLLVLGTPVPLVRRPEDVIRRVRADEFDLARILAVASVAFANGGNGGRGGRASRARQEGSR